MIKEDILQPNNMIAEYANASLLDMSYNYKNPPQIIWVENSSIATLGNFSASTGKAKAKKTFNVSAIVAAALANSCVLKYRANLPGGKHRILYVDTEQSRYHCHNVYERILKLAGLPADSNNENLDFSCLRERTPEMRIKIIDYLLAKRNDYGLVIIDGIRDLLLDINNATESAYVIGKMMEWSTMYNLHIHCVLHQNKGDNNSRGHIGTEMNNKAETVLVITKQPDRPENSTVEAAHIREKEFTPFAFTVNDAGLPEMVDGFVADELPQRVNRIKFKDLTMEQHKEALGIAFAEGKICGYKTIVNQLMKSYEQIGFKRGWNVFVDGLKFLINDLKLVVKQDKFYCLPNEQSDT